MPLLSVIIPVYNGFSRGLGRAVRSVVSQEGADAVEVICVDDCSDDSGATAALLGSLPVTSLRTPRNMRQGGARNLGVSRATGTFIAFLDQDDEWLPGVLPRILCCLRRFSGDLIVCDNLEHGSDAPKLGFSDEGTLTPHGFIDRNGPVYTPWRFFIRRSFYMSSSLAFRPDTRIEDIDWGLSLLMSASGGVRYLPVNIIRYRHGATTSAITSDAQICSDYLEACVRASRITDLPPKARALVAKSIDWGIQYLFLLPAPSAWKARVLGELPADLPYRRLIRLIISNPTVAAGIMNAGRPLWLLARTIYRIKHSLGK